MIYSFCRGFVGVEAIVYASVKELFRPGGKTKESVMSCREYYYLTGGVCCFAAHLVDFN